jgi:glutamyl-tRNA reductase
MKINHVNDRAMTDFLGWCNMSNYFCRRTMDSQHFKHISNFFVAGINYRKSDASIRGRYAINSDQYGSILEKAGGQGLNEIFILSTCNRTEIYGFAWCSHQLIELLCSETGGDTEGFKRSCYIKNGEEAVQHVFEVGAGLDSQILGDYEIVGQIKTAVKFAKENGFVHAFTERLINSVLQSSKSIKNNTELSCGTVSVSFAAVQYIRQHFSGEKNKSILLLGVGKIGRNTCRNMVDYLDTKNITLINRSPEKAAILADELGLRSASIDNLEEEIAKADIIVSATNADKPVILKEHLEGKGEKLIIDLSIPYNVAPDAQTLANVKLVNVDELSRLKDETLKMRKREIPKARAIIAELMEEFTGWSEMRRNVPMLRELKTKLKELYSHPVYIEHHGPGKNKCIDTQIQRVLNETAGKIKQRNERGCQYITALNEFIS